MTTTITMQTRCNRLGCLFAMDGRLFWYRYRYRYCYRYCYRCLLVVVVDAAGVAREWRLVVAVAVASSVLVLVVAVFAVAYVLVPALLLASLAVLVCGAS